MTYWDNGWYTVEDVPDGITTDFVDVVELDNKVAYARQAITKTEEAGFADPTEAANAMHEILTESIEDLDGTGVCAKVKLQIKQEAVITRDAFEATLELDNSTDGPLENVEVEVVITDEDGHDATDLFGVYDPTIQGFVPAGETWTLSDHTTGVANWLIVPTTEAAPEEPTVFFIGATLKYTDQGRDVTMPLEDVPITVLPQAELDLKYFHQRDAFTDASLVGDSLPDGYFRLIVAADKVHSVRDRTMAEDHMTDFHRLSGDGSGDGRVTAHDLLLVRQSFGTSEGDPGFNSDADVSGDGAVDEVDLELVRDALGNTVTPLAPPELIVEESSGAINDDRLHFGTVEIGTEAGPVPIVIRNTGQQALTIGSMQLVGGAAGDFGFQIVGEPAGNTGFILDGGATKTVEVTFAVAEEGERAGELRWWHNDASQVNPASVSLIGVGESAGSLDAAVGAGGLVGDLNGNGVVDDMDLNWMLSALGSDDESANLDGIGVVDAADVAILLGNFGNGLDELLLLREPLLAMPIGPAAYEATNAPFATRPLLRDGRLFVGPLLPNAFNESRLLIRPARSPQTSNRIDETGMIALRRARVDATFVRMATSRHSDSRARYSFLDDSLWEDGLGARNARHRHADVDQALEDELVWDLL